MEKSLFPALEKLELIGMRNLKEWKTAAAVRGGESFPCLRELRIREFPKLTELPSHLLSLENLDIYDSNATLVGQVMSLTSISSLEIGGIDELVVLPIGLLQNKKAFKYLLLHNISNLRTLSNEMDNLTTVESLVIRRCPSLESLPEGLKNLKSLERLELSSCHSFKSLTESWMVGLSSLTSLWVQQCKSIESLTEGVQHFTSLQDLRISGCPEMKSFPDGLQSLSTLKYLIIFYCPHLKRRCKKDTGEDWPKISHITEIVIDGQCVKNLHN